MIQDLIYGTTDVLTAKYFCDLIGVATVETTSIRKGNSIEGEIEDFGQKNISTQKRNLLNVDEILRIPSNKLLINLRGNKPILLDKVIYTEHPAASKLKDSLITEYNPEWIKNKSVKPIKKIEEDKPKNQSIRKREKLNWKILY